MTSIVLAARSSASVVIAAAVATVAPAVAEDRLAPYATQQAVLGCWNVGAGATLTLTPVGKHSVKAVARFSLRPKGGPAVMRDDGRWSAAEQSYVVPCRPRSQHGSICLVRPAAPAADATAAAEPGLSVRVVAYGYGGKVVGVVEELTATRCARAPR